MALCLVVDDDPMSCKIASGIAGSLGLQVRSEPNGVEALSFCSVTMPEIVILDIEMPRMDGISFLHELHKMIGGRRPYVIACTAKNDSETVKSLQKEEVNAYILKPFASETLAEKLTGSGLL